jgi:hypothetical protein
MTAQPTYVLELRAAPGTNAMRALRSLLRTALRRHGLKCVAAHEKLNHFAVVVGADDGKNAKRAVEMKAMDVSNYLGHAFLKVDDVKVNGPIRVVIENVDEGRYDKPDATFDDGTRLSLNVRNTRILARAYGKDTDDWIGKEIELGVGEIEYQGKMQETILVKPISPPIEKKAAPIETPTEKKTSSKRKGADGDLDDGKIPF